MKSIQTKAHIGKDGTLELRVATGLPESDAEVLVVVNPVPNGRNAEKRGWPPGFMDRFAGVLSDDPIERAEQGEYEAREELGTYRSGSTD